MILKIMQKNGTTTFVSADEFSVNKLFVTGIYKNFRSEYNKEQIEYYNDRHNHLVHILQKETKMTDMPFRFLFDCEFEELDLVLIIEPNTKTKEAEYIATNMMTFLMSDDGKTIERLI